LVKMSRRCPLGVVAPPRELPDSSGKPGLLNPN
jgi:hypothetical protein